MKIICWNVNSIRRRLSILQDLCKEESPDILLLQETKATDKDFPFELIHDMGYNISYSGEKTFNGVAVLSKHKLDSEVIKSFDNNPLSTAARYIETLVYFNKEVIRLINVYIPNGSEINSEKFMHKLEFLKSLEAYLAKTLAFNEKVLIAGDFNIAPEEIDIFDSTNDSIQVLCNIEVRKYFRRIIALGFHDSFRISNNQPHEYSWWDYRGGALPKNHGARIDHILLNNQLLDNFHSAGILKKTRFVKNTSDHAPIWCKLKI
jgi:exodeoxyribonuclease-3